MISKKINRSGKTSNFERLGRYLVNAENMDATVMWTRTAEYILDETPDSDGEKVLWYRISNCDAEVPAMAVAEIEVTQSRNTRSKAERTMHLVVSFPEGETPSRAQIEDVEDHLCAVMGYGTHQRISAVHQDTDNMHLHIAINKINPQTHNIHDPKNDYYIRDKACRELEIKHGLAVDNGIGEGKRYGQEQAQQAHGQQETLWNWIQENAKPALVNATQTVETWEGLHGVFQEFGLQIKPRGAGLVIGTLDGSVHIKASAIDRGLSFKPLLERFGEYQAPENSRVQVKIQYQPRTKLPDEEAKQLYAAFQQEKNQTILNRQTFRLQQAQERSSFTTALGEWYQAERQRIQSSRLNATSRKCAYQTLSEAKRQHRDLERQKQAQKRQAFYATDKPKTWEEFLARASEAGNTKALALLRQRKQRQERLASAILTANDLEKAKIIVYEHLKPYSRPNGDLVYRVQDGGSVIDERTRVRVDGISAGSAFLALTMAAERFHGQPLDVQGESSFKTQIAQFAAQYGMNVTFKDAALEKQRQQLLLDRQAEHLTPALEAFIGQRNQTREKVLDILPHRIWTSADSGDLMYQGRRNLVDGSQVVLLQKDGLMLVKPTRAEDLQNLKVRQVVSMDKTGVVIPVKGRTHER